MTQEQIYNILTQVFSEFNVTLLNKGTWSKIKVDNYLEVYTYSGLPESNSIWYFNTFYDGYSKETMIPNVNPFEFIQVYKDIYVDIANAKSILISATERLNSIDSKENIRDKKINNIIDYDIQNTGL